jgi:hypothetical protein
MSGEMSNFSFIRLVYSQYENMKRRQTYEDCVVVFLFILLLCTLTVNFFRLVN